MLNLHDLQDRLTDAFIDYQWQLDNPFSSTPNACAIGIRSIKLRRYHSDPIFRAKVDSIVVGVTDIVSTWVDGSDRGIKASRYQRILELMETMENEDG